MKKIYQKLVDKEATLAVIGLGYVGLPLAVEFGKKFNVIGFDINKIRIDDPNIGNYVPVILYI